MHHRRLLTIWTLAGPPQPSRFSLSRLDLIQASGFSKDAPSQIHVTHRCRPWTVYATCSALPRRGCSSHALDHRPRDLVVSSDRKYLVSGRRRRSKSSRRHRVVSRGLDTWHFSASPSHDRSCDNYPAYPHGLLLRCSTLTVAAHTCLQVSKSGHARWQLLRRASLYGRRCVGKVRLDLIAARSAC